MFYRNTQVKEAFISDLEVHIMLSHEINNPEADPNPIMTHLILVAYTASNRLIFVFICRIVEIYPQTSVNILY